MKGIIDYNINKFETRYAEMYSQAIVILKNGTSSDNEEVTETSAEIATSEDAAEETEYADDAEYTEYSGEEE
jgi:hypothetical protein